MQFKILSQQQNFLERIDIFGIGINIRFNKKAEHKTKIGGIVSLIIFGILAYQIKIIVDNQYDTQNPFVLFEQRFTSEPERYYLKNDRFMLIFGLQDSKSQHYMDPTVYKATLWIKQTVKTLDPTTNQYVSNQQKRIVQTEPCRIDHFNIPDVNKYFTTLAYQKMYCISKSETDLFIEGQFDALHYSTLELIVESCTGANCNANMNTILKLCRLAIYYVDYSVIPSNKENPFQPLGRQSFWISGPEFTKQTNISFRNTYLKSDYGFIGQDVHMTRSLTFSGDREQTAPKSNNILYDCYISFEKNIDSVYKRSYQKVDKSISQLGGIFNILFAFGAVLCRPLSQIELNLKLINRLFHFEDDSDDTTGQQQQKDKKNIQKYGKNQNNQNQNSTSKEDYATQQDQQIQLSQDTQNQDQFKQDFNRMLKTKIFQSVPIKSESDDNTNSRSKNLACSSFNPFNPVVKRQSLLKEKSVKLKKVDSKQKINKTQQNDEREKQTDEMKKFFNVSNNKISFQGWEYFSNFFKFSNLCRNRRHLLLQKGVEKLYNQIDIFYLIQKMLEVEKLKRLLLNENQIKLFEFIPRPVLTLEEKKTSHVSDKVGILYEDDKDLVQKTNDAQVAFSSILNQQQKPSKIDLRILELLDPHFKLFLQEIGEGQGDLSTLQRPTSNILDVQKYSLSAQRDNQPDEMQIATEGMPIKFYSSDLANSPRRALEGLYSSQTKANQTNLIQL